MKIKDRLDLPLGHKTLVIFDVFRAQITEEFRNKLRAKHFVYVTIPPCCTDKLQPMDLSVNKMFKDQMKQKFQMCYSEQVMQQMKDDGDCLPDPSKIDLSLGALKAISSKWLCDTHIHVQKNPNLVISGFREAGIVDHLGEFADSQIRSSD